MKEGKLDVTIKKVEEYRLQPLLENIVSFVHDIKPILNNINSAIEENIAKMPKATKKLSKVTEATENATTEILNIIDEVFLKVSEVSSQLDNITGETNEPYVCRSKELLNEINNDSTSIMMSLQVQDITSQQIAAVNHLLLTIQKKLADIIMRFQASELSGLVASIEGSVERQANVSKLHREIAFDPEAIRAVDSSLNRQESVDDIIKKHSLGTLSESDLAESQYEDEDDEISGEIGQLFAEQSGYADSDSDDGFSTDDIDDLFSVGGADDEISTDDIDDLFSK